MAGKRKRIQLDDRLFSTTPIQKPTILSWAAAVKWTPVEFALRVTQHLRDSMLTGSGVAAFAIAQGNTGFAAALVRTIALLNHYANSPGLEIVISRESGYFSQATLRSITELTLRDALTLDQVQGKLLRLLLAMGATDYIDMVLNKKAESILAPLDLYLTSAGLTLFCQIAKIPIDRD